MGEWAREAGEGERGEREAGEGERGEREAGEGERLGHGRVRRVREWASPSRNRV
jgi:hypothetical protein